MNFDLPESHTRARDCAHALGLSAIAPSAEQRDRERSWDPAIFRSMAAGGLLGAPLPAEYGGGECTALETVLLQEGFGRGSEDAGVALAWGAHTFLCGVPIWKLGTPAQRQRYLPSMCCGDRIGGFAAQERAAGSDRTAVQTVAVKRRDRWLLTGTKTWVTNGAIGNLFVVTAATGEAGTHGVSLFIVERNFPGFHVGCAIDTLGLRTAAISELRFDQCEVPHENLLGHASHAFPLIARWERACLLSHWLGLMHAAFERCARHVRERHQFGRPIAQFQAVRTILADMKIRHSLTRWTAYRAAAAIDAEAPHADRHAAAAKLYLSQAAQQTMRAAIELHGADGFVAGHPVERAYRDAAALAMLAGNTDLLRSVIAGSLLSLG